METIAGRRAVLRGAAPRRPVPATGARGAVS